MKVYFDDAKDFYEDLNNLVAKLDRFNNPIVVVPTDKDVKKCVKLYSEDENTSHITFISYDFFISRMWLADGVQHDHIDFFRMDQFFISKSYGVPVGVGTMRRLIGRKDKEETNNVQ